MIRPTRTILLGLTLTSAGLFTTWVPGLAAMWVVGMLLLGVGVRKAWVKR